MIFWNLKLLNTFEYIFIFFDIIGCYLYSKRENWESKLHCYRAISMKEEKEGNIGETKFLCTPVVLDY